MTQITISLTFIKVSYDGASILLSFSLVFFFFLSVDSASGAFATNDEGAVMDTGGNKQTNNKDTELKCKEL